MKNKYSKQSSTDRAQPPGKQSMSEYHDCFSCVTDGSGPTTPKTSVWGTGKSSRKAELIQFQNQVPTGWLIKWTLRSDLAIRYWGCQIKTLTIWGQSPNFSKWKTISEHWTSQLWNRFSSTDLSVSCSPLCYTAVTAFGFVASQQCTVFEFRTKKIFRDQKNHKNFQGLISRADLCPQ